MKYQPKKYNALPLLLIDRTAPPLSGHGAVMLMASFLRLAPDVILKVLGIHYLIVIRTGAMPVLFTGGK